MIDECQMRREMTFDNWEAWSNERWKREINESVKEYGKSKWREGINQKSSLDWYALKECPKTEPCYDGSLGSELLFKARTKSLELNSGTYRWENNGEKTCRKCDTGVDETVEHVLLECVKYERDREHMLNVVKEAVGPDRWAEISPPAGDPIHLVLFLLGLSEVEQWSSATMEGVKHFLEKMWLTRKDH